jgi:hypothetical protein
LRVSLVHHLGLGDHVVCLGLYRELAASAKSIVFVVKSHNAPAVRAMLADVPSVHIVAVHKKFADVGQRALQFVLGTFGFSKISLGSFGNGFLMPEEDSRFDEDFYRQAGVAFDKRWGSFTYRRNESREIALFKTTGLRKGEYVFLHEDARRGFNIDRHRLPTDLPVFSGEPRIAWGFLDYRTLIENAAEIHCIESSFAAFIEGMCLEQPKFAHRYARPEAMQDARFEFTYRSNWAILAEEPG